LRDLADLHIAALTNSKAANKRFVFSHPFTFDNFADALRKVPEVESRVGKNNQEQIALPRFDMKPVEEAFGIKWRSIDETAKACALQLLDIEGHKA
jgi:hypothetical protein